MGFHGCALASWFHLLGGGGHASRPRTRVLAVAQLCIYIRHLASGFVDGQSKHAWRINVKRRLVSGRARFSERAPTAASYALCKHG